MSQLAMQQISNAAARPDDSIDLSQVKRVLVVMLRHHGDVLLTTPLYRALKRLNPAVEIDVLTYHATRGLLEGNPDITTLYSVSKDKKHLSLFGRLAAELEFMRAIKKRRYDLMIHLSDHRRGAWLARWVGAPVSIAPRLRNADLFWRSSFTHLWTNALSVSGGHPLLRRHTVEQHLDALRRLGLDVNPAPALQLYPDAEAKDLAQAFLAEHGVTKPYVLIQPTSRWMFKCWPVTHNAALVKALLARGFAVVLSCGPSDTERSMLDAIVAHLGTPPADLVLANKPSTLARLAVLIGGARVFVGVDSAPMHMAAAMGTPTVALFGPSGEDNWAPWKGDGNLIAKVVTHSGYACRPCGQDGCGGSKVSQCLVQLPVSRVLSAFDEVLAQAESWQAL